MKVLPIGIKSFSKLSSGKYDFVDKTLMIQDFLNRGQILKEFKKYKYVFND